MGRLEEAASLARDGVLELNLIAQDLTAYGRDRSDGSSLAVLFRPSRPGARGTVASPALCVPSSVAATCWR